MTTSRNPVITPGTLPRVPNQPKTPLKSFRIPDDLYRAAQAAAAERGESLSRGRPGSAGQVRQASLPEVTNVLRRNS